MIDQAVLGEKRAEIEQRAQAAAQENRWRGIALDGVKRAMAATVAERLTKDVTGFNNWIANDIRNQTHPYNADDARAAELHQELVAVAVDQLMGTASEIAVQRAMVQTLFFHFDSYRQQIQRGNQVDVEALQALGATIASAVRVLQETAAVDAAEPVAA